MTKLITPVGEMQRSAAKSMRTLADKVQNDHQGMLTHKHLRDAARTTERGQLDGAKRHLDAAVHEMQPQTLYRHGLLTDDHHALAKQNMGEINRHRLLVRDIEDVKARNQENISRLRSEAAGTSIPAAPEPSSSVNAPNKTHVGRIDINVAAGPKEPPPTTSQNHLSNGYRDMLEFAAWEHELRDGRGEWMSTERAGFKSVKNVKFTYRGGAGSFSHARAIKELGESFAPTGEISTRQFNSPDSVILKNALRHAAEAMVRRDMTAARAHFGMAIQSAARLGPAQEALVMAARDSLDKVPPYHTYRMEPRYRSNASSQALKELGFRPRVQQEFSWQDELRNRHGEWSSMSDDAISAIGERHGSDVASHLRAFKTAGSKSEAIGHIDAAYSKISANMRGNRDVTAHGSRLRIRDAGLLNTLNTMRKQASAINLSAETGRLASTPAPNGRPGGPGLYGKKGNKHSDYFEHVVRALMEKRGMDQGHASAVAWAALRKWRAKSKHAEVKTAATGALAQEAAAGATHAHSNRVEEFREIWTLANVMASIELVGTAAGSAKDNRSTANGRYIPAGQSSGSKSTKPAKGGKPVKGHPHHQNQPSAKAKEKAQLMAQIHSDRAQIRGLIAQLHAINRNPSASSSYKPTSSTTSAAAAAAAAAKTAAASSTASAATAASKYSPTPKVLSPAQQARRAAIRARINALRAQIRAAERQVAHL